MVYLFILTSIRIARPFEYLWGYGAFLQYPPSSRLTASGSAAEIKWALLLCLLSSVCTVPLLNGPYGLWGSLQACIPQEVNLLWMIKHRANELHYHSGVSNTVWNIDSLVSAWMDSFLALFKKSHYIKSCAELSDHSKAYTTTTGPLSIQEVAWSKSNFCFL